jgi:hypothetical protein
VFDGNNAAILDSSVRTLLVFDRDSSTADVGLFATRAMETNLRWLPMLAARDNCGVYEFFSAN